MLVILVKLRSVKHERGSQQNQVRNYFHRWYIHRSTVSVVKEFGKENEDVCNIATVQVPSTTTPGLNLLRLLSYSKQTFAILCFSSRRECYSNEQCTCGPLLNLHNRQWNIAKPRCWNRGLAFGHFIFIMRPSNPAFRCTTVHLL